MSCGEPLRAALSFGSFCSQMKLLEIEAEMLTSQNSDSLMLSVSMFPFSTL
jgi:hypothetical protein